MTITALAQQLGVSTPTIYRRLKDRNVSLADLRDGNELTQYGVETISSLFDGARPVSRNASEMEHETTHETIHGDTVNMAVKVAQLTAQVDGLTALVEQVMGERDELRRQLATMTAALEREQADRQQERLLLTGGPEGQRHWWQKLFNRN